ncbi:nucleotidyl transferase AbiEii/AbiGii toxin family protein [Patescibacteria group bacterium]|nr:nucleotidyl transferase AbiEii/AbiGii toxin family protein [Patescibacteria group bacterium]MBU4016751.1 nucleotidyl transferase AbiEii/AbiGii toxin family protein [Patescibacteria group bacterium]MBU4098714.1 nucleotidyl transferase AbiEii/AbiGii toxin family protein [Patescibacteria group bacterium]
MLDRQKHEQVLKYILKDIYTTTDLEARLALKGGTCLYMFYGLDRFSVDLDFNLLAEDFDDQLVINILTKYLIINDRMNKYFTWFWLGSYEKGKQQVKIEISKREYPDKYINKDFYGLTIPTMSPGHMFAHKLCAITDRKKLQNRDLYDAHFMFVKQFDIEEEIIKLRIGKTMKEYFSFLIEFIEKNVNPNNILDGLGELVKENQKDRIRDTLKKDIIFDLKSRL